MGPQDLFTPNGHDLEFPRRIARACAYASVCLLGYLFLAPLSGTVETDPIVFVISGLLWAYFAAPFIWMGVSLRPNARSKRLLLFRRISGAYLLVSAPVPVLLYVEFAATLLFRPFEFFSYLAVFVMLAAVQIPLSWGLDKLRLVETTKQTLRRSFAFGFLGVLYVLGPFLALTLLAHAQRGRFPEHHNGNPAVRSLRTLSTAMVTYSVTYGGFPSTLRHLGLVGRGTSPNCRQSDLIDDALATGYKDGYHFQYRSGPRDVPLEGGCPPGADSYSIVAVPLQYVDAETTPSFFTDQTGVVRITRENRPATADDPPI